MATADPQKLKKAKEISFREILMGIALLPESTKIVFGGSGFKLHEIDLTLEKPEPTHYEGEGHFSYITKIASTQGGIVSGGYDGRLIWWNAAEHKQVRAVDAHEKWIRNLIVTPDGKTVISVADDMVCKLWNAETGEHLQTYTDHEKETPTHYPSMLFAVAVSSDGKLLATGDKVGHVVIRNLESGDKLAELDAPKMYTWDHRHREHSIGGIRSLAFSPNSELLVVGGIGQIGNVDHLEAGARIEMFDWKQNQSIKESEDKKMKGLVEQIVFHPSGEWFLTIGGDHKGFVTIYNTEKCEILHQADIGNHLHACAANADLTQLHTVGHEKLALWTLS